MPAVIIDGRPVNVPKGTTVIEAAEAVGIFIPRLCWHKALGAAGACRLCAVYFTEGPVTGLHMSCMTPAADGMVVDTGHPEAVAFRRQVMEWLMANHPHDCPVCDEGGGCLLQDMTIAAGHSLRRFPGRKRTFPDQDLGPFIQHEMNRCIHCYRCARFYQEYAGYRDFGPLQNANRVWFGRFAPGALESPFAGNLADICPTGTLTDKTARYKARRWETERAPSVCPHCALGCHTTVAARNREIVRVEAREHPDGNGYFLCDRGRFSHGCDTAPDRPRRALVDGAAVTPEIALTDAAHILAATAARHGPAAIACVGGTRASQETLAALHALAARADWSEPAHFPTARQGRDLRAALAATTPDRARPLTGLERADAVLCLGVAPLFDAPLLALALRQARRQGATVIIVDPRPQDLPLDCLHLPVAPRLLPVVADMLCAGAAITREAARSALSLNPELWSGLEQAAHALETAKAPAVVFAPALAGHLPAEARFGLCPVPLGANAAGAARLATDTAPGLDDLARDIASGRIRTLVVVEADPLAAWPEPDALIARLDALIVLDHLPTATTRAASLLLPTTTLHESGGTLHDHLGRPYRAVPVHAVGEPVSREGHGGHPPRDYARPLAGADPRPAWQWLADLAAAPGLATEAPPAVRPTSAPTPPMPAQGRSEPAFPADQGLTVVFTDTLFGTEALGRHAPLVATLAPAPSIVLHADDAPAFGLADGDTALVEAGGRFVAVSVTLRRDLARGVAVLPRYPELARVAPILGPCGLRRR